MLPPEALLTQEVQALRQEIRLLRDKFDALIVIKRLFGTSNANLPLFLLQANEGADNAEDSSASCAALEIERARSSLGHPKSDKPHWVLQPRAPEHLPAVEEVAILWGHQTRRTGDASARRSPCCWTSSRAGSCAAES